MRPMSLRPRLVLLLSLPPLLWAGNAVVGRMMVGQVPPLTLNFLRWGLAALILLPMAWRSLFPLRRITQRWPYLLALGVLGVGLFNSLQYLALVSSTPLNVTLVASSLSVWMLVIGALFYGERPRTPQVLGAVLGIAGVATVVSRGSLEVLWQVRFVAGDLYILLAIIGWSVYSWLLARPPAPMRGSQRPPWDWAGFLLIQTLFGLFGAAVFSTGEQSLGTHPVQWGLPVLAALLYLAVGPSILAYRCWGLGVTEAGPALAAFFNNLTPLFAALLSVWAFGDVPQPYHALAFALIVGGIAASSVDPRKPRHGR